MDNQFEYRFATGPFRHTALMGLDLNITRDFKVVASYTNYDLFVSKDLDPTLIGTVPTAKPRQAASFWMDYTFRDSWLDGFGFGGGVRYIGSSFADTANLLTVPSVVLGDLAVHYEWANNGARRLTLSTSPTPHMSQAVAL